MPNIAIKPLKRSAPEFMIKRLKENFNYHIQLNESGIPNDSFYLQNINRLISNLIRKSRRPNTWSDQKYALQNKKSRENYHFDKPIAILVYYTVIYSLIFWSLKWAMYEILSLISHSFVRVKPLKGLYLSKEIFISQLSNVLGYVKSFLPIYRLCST